MDISLVVVVGWLAPGAASADPHQAIAV